MAADKRCKMTNAVDTPRSFHHYRVVIWTVRASGVDGRIAWRIMGRPISGAKRMGVRADAELESEWKSLVERNGYICRYCGHAPCGSERETFLKTHLCEDCAQRLGETGARLFCARPGREEA